ncbi:MAG: hypothetical protein WD740_07850 [Anaerolineales bacterium]
MRSNYLLLTLFALLLAACQPAVPGALPAGQVVLNPGEAIASTDGRVSLTFLEVLEDSRCPADALCVWQGNVSVLVEFSLGTETQQARLTLGEMLAGDVNSIQVSSTIVTLSDVQPYPLASQPTDPADHEITLTIANN